MSRAEQLFGIDRRSLTAFRIGRAALLLADLAYRALDFRAHYTDQGVLPRALYLEIFSEVDLHTGEALDWDRPRRASRNNHWWKYQLVLSQPAKRRLRPAYARVLIREWNSEHAAARHVASLELVKIDARRVDEPISKLPREVLWRGRRRGSGSRP